MSSRAPDAGRPRVGWHAYSPHAGTWRERVSAPADSASVRVRCLAPCAALKRAGWSSERFAEDRAERYDVVVFQKAYDARSLWLAERLKAHGTRLVLDLCDNHFHNPRGAPELADRIGRLQTMLDIADAISVSTPALAETLPDVGRPVLQVDDAVDPLLAGAGEPPATGRGDGPLRILWFGMQPADLEIVEEDLAAVHAEAPVRLTAIGNSPRAVRELGRRAGVPTRHRRWRRRSFVVCARGHDVCIIPIQKNPFTVVKTSNRVASSLLLGVPVVASRIPSYEEFADCILFEDWRESLMRYARDPALAATHVRAGRAHIRARYTSEHLVRQWSRVLEAALS